MPCVATQDRQVMMEKSDRMWSTGEENGKPLQYSCLENPMNSMKMQKDRTLKDELPSHLPPHNISLGYPHAPAPSMLYPHLQLGAVLALAPALHFFRSYFSTDLQ